MSHKKKQQQNLGVVINVLSSILMARQEISDLNFCACAKTELGELYHLRSYNVHVY